MQYSKKVLQHFMKPKNQGRLKNPDGIGMVGNPACGDIMTVYIKVKKKKDKSRSKTSSLRGKEIISDIKFETLGCAAAIATSSMVTEMAKGKNLDDAYKISRQDVSDSLEGLPPAKMHCSNLAENALKRAIEDYRSKNKTGAEKRTRRR
ncbi:MAG: iron-sulfur cluster assembly scaffold protein [Candidatus Moranbacteria bacterium RBG_13_45_13]|nr:MAG: iron-sulfur cluster assembly scaffold protein [Candidatus Moranbacteria bacterium RBG_13_45_13]